MQYKSGMWLISDKNRATVCRQLVINKDYLPSLVRLSPDDRLTVSQVLVTHFKNRSCRSVSQPSTDDRPIEDMRSVESKPFRKFQRQTADRKEQTGQL